MTVAFTYDALPGRVVFASGSRRSLPGELDRLAVERVLLVGAGEDLARAPEMFDILGDRVVAHFDDVVQHVPVVNAEAARALARSCGAEATVTFGGGSAVGYGKAVALTSGLPVVAVPTTYAGSEMTPIWGMTDAGTKTTGRDPVVLPRTVVYDPELTLALPPGIAGPSGMNALAHAVEALYAPGANPVTSLVAVEAVRVLHGALPAVCDHPQDLDARADALYGAYLAASALAVAGTALHHKTTHALGGRFNLDHAGMNAVVLPHALAYNAPAMPGIYAQLSEALGGDAADALWDLARRLDAPASLAELGMPAEGIDEITPAVVEAAAANVRPPDTASVRAMIDDAFHGRRPNAATAAT